jgi:hypothetical protein
MDQTTETMMKKNLHLLGAVLLLANTWTPHAAEPVFESLFDGQTPGQWASNNHRPFFRP